VEQAFGILRDPLAMRAEASPDLNEYQFAANQPIGFVDYLGGGILCSCGYVPPKLPAFLVVDWIDFSRGPTIKDETDQGRFTCTPANQGTTVKVTVPNACSQRSLVPYCLFDCTKRDCHIRKIFTCLMNKGKPRWAFTSYTITKGCP
jgi:hypothetical protein